MAQGGSLLKIGRHLRMTPKKAIYEKFIIKDGTEFLFHARAFARTSNR